MASGRYIDMEKENRNKQAAIRDSIIKAQIDAKAKADSLKMQKNSSDSLSVKKEEKSKEDAVRRKREIMKNLREQSTVKAKDL